MVGAKILITISLLQYCSSEKAFQRTAKLDYKEGYFGKFCRQVLELLSMGMDSIELYKKFCTVLAGELDAYDNKVTGKMAKKLHKLIQEEDEEFESEFAEYKEYYDNMTPKQAEFFTSMDKLMNAYHGTLFNDYIYDLTNYATGRKISITDETVQVIEAIFKVVRATPKYVQEELDKKMKRAIRDIGALGEDEEARLFKHYEELLLQHNKHSTTTKKCKESKKG